MSARSKPRARTMQAATAETKRSAPHVEIAASKGELVPVAKFREELEAADIDTLLPPHLDAAKFMATVVNAINANPDLLTADRRSLQLACTRAAEDGLHPDGREGVMNVYNENRRLKRNGQWHDNWVKAVCWIPMVYGIRKRAREICAMVIDAQVVHKNDHFDREQGDHPRIVHRPAPLGTARGEMIGAYAIFKIGEEILHREVMDAEQIAAVFGVVKAQNGLMWKTFTSEAWRKSVLRRGIKSIPSVHPQIGAIERIAARNDDQFAFDRPAAAAPIEAASSVALAPPPNFDDAETVSQPEPEFDGRAYLDELDLALQTCATIAALESEWAKREPIIESKLPLNLRHEAYDLYGKHEQRIISSATTE